MTRTLDFDHDNNGTDISGTWSGGLKIKAGKVSSAMIADGTIATADLANGAVTDAKLASSFVHAGGDTMSGDLTMNANIVMGAGKTVDGVDVDQAISNHETRIKALEGKAPTDWKDLNGPIPDNKVPQYMRPFAFGTVTLGGAVANNRSYNLKDSGVNGKVQFQTS